MTEFLDFNPKDAHLIESIPGLKLNGFTARGSVDAIDAARHVLHLPALKRQAKWHEPIHPAGARPYQDEGINWMLRTVSDHHGCILSDEMGLGKTFQSISLMRETMVGRALILCPGSVRETWRDELKKFDPTAKVAVLYPGTGPASGWDTAASAKYVVCSHDYRMIDRAEDIAFAGTYPEFLILDEAHRFRGRKSKRTGALEDLAAMVPFKIALTGTPEWNSMRDWYALLKLLFGYRFGNQYDFDRRYAGAKPGTHGGLEYPKKEDEKITPKVLNTEELRIRLSHYMMGRTKAEVAPQMPSMTVSIRWVDPTPEAKQALRKVQMGTKSQTSPINDAIQATLKGKVDEVLALAAEAKRFVLTTWTNQGAADLHRLLNQQGTPCILATASMSGQKRAEAIRSAIERRCGLVATTDLFAEGLNLQKVASVGILHALDFVPRKMQQLMGRLHRIDITEPVIWHVVAMRESIDQHIINANVFKLDTEAMGKGKTSGLRTALKNEKKESITERAALARLYEIMGE